MAYLHSNKLRLIHMTQPATPSFDFNLHSNKLRLIQCLMYILPSFDTNLHSNKLRLIHNAPCIKYVDESIYIPIS